MKLPVKSQNNPSEMGVFPSLRTVGRAVAGAVFLLSCVSRPLQAGEEGADCQLPGTSAGAMTLASGGKALATIMIPDDASPAERTAAAELSAYLAKATAAIFEIKPESAATAGDKIWVGPGKLSRAMLGDDLVNGLGPEEYVVKTVGNDLLLVGGRPRGTLYAVYSFLESEVGCRWFNWWGDESVPKRALLAAGKLNRRGAPSFAVRDIVTHTNPNPDRQRLKQFLVRNRDQGPDLSLSFTGGLTGYGGTSHEYRFPPNGWLVHTLFQWVPPAPYFKEHPEYYSLLKGNRVKHQLCFSNPGLRKILTASILKQMAKDQGTGNFPISAQDVTGPLCECVACQALVEREGTPGAPLFDYLAELGPIAKRAYPKAFITTLAYREEQTEKPPRSIVLPDNVIVIFAPIDSNFATSFEHPSNQGALKNIKAWGTQTRHLWVWYYTNPYACDPPLPVGNLEKTAQDLRLFKRLGVEGLFLQHDAGVDDSQRLADLQTWLLTKLMWNPDQNLPRLIMDFTDRYYGAAAPFIGQYVDALEEATQTMKTPMSWDAAPGQYRYLTPKLLATIQKLFDRAEQAVAHDPGLLLRVRQARMSPDLACTLLWDKYGVHPGFDLNRDQIISRYRETYTQTVHARIPASRQATCLKNMADFLKWRTPLTPLKPLPPPLDQIPRDRIRQLTPESASLEGGAKLEQDPDAAGGFAAVLPTDGSLPFNMGYYDELAKRFQHMYLGKDEQIVPDTYHFYKIGRTVLSAQCLVWLDNTWHIRFRDLTGFYDVDCPAQTWDIYASVRFEGSGYGGKELTATTNRISVDRVVLVQAAPSARIDRTGFLTR